MLDKRRRNVVFVTIMLGMLLAALDQTIVGTALPTIVSDLGGAAHMSWVVTSYLLAETVATVLVGKFGDLFGRKVVFQVSAIFVVALFLKQVELRDSARAGSTDMGEGFASPSGADSQRVLEAAVGKIIGSTDRDTARGLMTDSDTRLDIAGAWAVMQVELHTRMVGHASLGMIAARRRLPPEVLLPVFDRMVEEGYPTLDGTLLSHTRAGARGAGHRSGVGQLAGGPGAAGHRPPLGHGPEGGRGHDREAAPGGGPEQRTAAACTEVGGQQHRLSGFVAASPRHGE